MAELSGMFGGGGSGGALKTVFISPKASVPVISGTLFIITPTASQRVLITQLQASIGTDNDINLNIGGTVVTSTGYIQSSPQATSPGTTDLTISTPLDGEKLPAVIMGGKGEAITLSTGSNLSGLITYTYQLMEDS